jgi:[ribosomal protein S5]-alanine N-acetyltransferase
MDLISIEPIHLKGQRLVLNPVTLSGLDDFNEYSICQDFYQYLEFPVFEDLNESKKYLQGLIDRSKSKLQQFWFIEEAKSKKIIGSFGVHSLDRHRSSVEIGYGISPYYWGNGYFQESANIIIKYLFNDIGLHRIVARTFKENTASIAGLEKLGFNIEGTMKDYYKKHDGNWFDGVLMAKLNSNQT